MVLALTLGIRVSSGAAALDRPLAEDVAVLAAEVRSTGWIAYGARSAQGDWDLFVCRPDGSENRPLTRTAEFNEFSPQFSRDGSKLLYRRIPRDETIDNNQHGVQGELVVSGSDGGAPVALGAPGEFPWASWNPDGARIASLSIKGIHLIDLATREVARSFPRQGFFQQLVWSPDGQWLVGVANAYGASWSIARMNVETGEAAAVNRIDCCTPDWFPDSKRIIFSWRPPGQKANNGYGWTQLWMADAAGQTRQLVYGEDGRHVYGGCVSPDGRYALFTGNMQEDGDPGDAGAPMNLMRLSDAPIIRGESRELRNLHGRVNQGPVLTLPVGWEPTWTAHDLALSERSGSRRPAEEDAYPAAPSPKPSALDAAELRTLGWLVFSARTARGDWDLVCMRPDGSERVAVTDTRDFNEAGARFSPDGRRVLYYRQPASEPIDNNTYGTHELVIMDLDGRRPTVFGDGFPWASWGPEGRRIACLTRSGIRIVDVATRRVLQEMPRQGFVSQLVWSPDGRRLVGTANGLGPYWNIGCLDLATGQLRAVSETERYNCTPDWAPDGRRILYARGIVPEQGGYAELWSANEDASGQRRLYAEPDHHIYGACASPDGQYLLFTLSTEDLGVVPESHLAIIRWPASDDTNPNRPPPRVDLGPGWEPHWTSHEVFP